jgi:hypothetical protein
MRYGMYNKGKIKGTISRARHVEKTLATVEDRWPQEEKKLPTRCWYNVELDPLDGWRAISRIPEWGPTLWD